MISLHLKMVFATILPRIEKSDGFEIIL